MRGSDDAGRVMGFRTRTARLPHGSVAMAWLLLAACAPPPAPPPPAADPLPLPLQRADPPAGAGAAEPRLSAGADGRLYLSWLEPAGESAHALRFSTWDAGVWAAPRTIATGDDWFVNWADFPSIAALADGTLAAHWLPRSGTSTYAYDVAIAVSPDHGATWSAPRRPHDDGTATEHGFVTLVPAPDGRFDVVWLDGRQFADDPPGPMTLRHARVNRDGSVTGGALVDARVCDCCPTDAARLPDGTLVAIYRGRTEEEIRDIRVARFDGQRWSAPTPVHADGWEVAGCPVNGPALAQRDGLLAAAWYTEPEGASTGRVRLAFSRDGGVSFDAPRAMDLGQPIGRVDVAWIDSGTALVTWIEKLPAGAAILARAAHVDETEARAPRELVATSVARSSGFPRLLQYDGRTFLAWTETSDPSRIRTAVLERADR